MWSVAATLHIIIPDDWQLVWMAVLKQESMCFPGTDLSGCPIWGSANLSRTEVLTWIGAVEDLDNEGCWCSGQNFGNPAT